MDRKSIFLETDDLNLKRHVKLPKIVIKMGDIQKEGSI